MRHYSTGPERQDVLSGRCEACQFWSTRIIPHFETYPLLSGKQRDFELFADICARMARRAHLARTGLQEIVRLAARMNPSGKRGYHLRGSLRLAEMKA